MSGFDASIRVDAIVSGKLRRYHHLTWWQQLLKVRTIVLPNLIDMIRVVGGLFQSLFKLIVWRPDVVFTKGGFVCLPIGCAARILHIPLVIHDSDAHPGLTNRILGRFATRIGTGAPLKYYTYPPKISRYVGVPIMDGFIPYDKQRRIEMKRKLGFGGHRPLIVVTGGGLGARRINVAVARNLTKLLSRCDVMLISGEAQYDELRATTMPDTSHYQLKPFVSQGMAMIEGAADIAVSRAGATTLLELAALAKPTILIPNGYLSGGHQLKNAAVYAEKGAVLVVDENELERRPELLLDAVFNLLADPHHMDEMGEAFRRFAKPHAARDMADLVLEPVGK